MKNLRMKNEYEPRSGEGTTTRTTWDNLYFNYVEEPRQQKLQYYGN